jgi:hypothetical protein
VRRRRNSAAHAVPQPAGTGIVSGVLPFGKAIAFPAPSIRVLVLSPSLIPAWLRRMVRHGGCLMIPLRLMSLAFGLALAGAASAADTSGGSAVSPAPLAAEADTLCTAPRVLSGVISRFNWAERNTFKRGFELSALANPRANPDPVLNVGVIPKRYCMAEAVMSNGTRSTAYYVVLMGQGLAGIGNGLDFCILGLDPWRVHDGECRTVR